MLRLAAFLVSLVLLAAPARAGETWGIPHERLTILAGTVVDVLCVLKGDCPPSCGGGRRQLGVLIRDGTLRLVAKGNIDFASPAADLLPYCGKEVEIDGLMVENPHVTLFFAQGVRPAGSAVPFEPADRFLERWKARTWLHDAEEWWRADPDANRIIAEDGPYGIKGLLPEKK